MRKEVSLQSLNMHDSILKFSHHGQAVKKTEKEICMSTVKELLGEELYGKVRSKLGTEKGLIIDDGMLIPKHRFDCINLSLKEHKQLAAELRERLTASEAKLNHVKETERELEKLKKEYRILELILESKPKNYAAVRANINADGPIGKKTDSSVRKQIAALKKSDSYLFYNDEQLYRLVPVGRAAQTEPENE